MGVGRLAGYQAFKEQIRERYNHIFTHFGMRNRSSKVRSCPLLPHLPAHTRSRSMCLSMFDLVICMFVPQCIIMLLTMAYEGGHSHRRVRSYPSKRVVGLVIACALLSLIWVNAGSKRKLPKTCFSLSKQAEKSAASAAPARYKQPSLDAQLRNITALPTKSFTSAPFPRLPPPDNEEYMAICMAGEYLKASSKSQSSRILSPCPSEEPICGSPRIFLPSLFPPWHTPLLYF